jgi:hypothetical protein
LGLGQHFLCHLLHHHWLFVVSQFHFRILLSSALVKLQLLYPQLDPAQLDDFAAEESKLIAF